MSGPAPKVPSPPQKQPDSEQSSHFVLQQRPVLQSAPAQIQTPTAAMQSGNHDLLAMPATDLMELTGAAGGNRDRLSAMRKSVPLADLSQQPVSQISDARQTEHTAAEPPVTLAAQQPPARVEPPVEAPGTSSAPAPGLGESTGQDFTPENPWSMEAGMGAADLFDDFGLFGALDEDDSTLDQPSSSTVPSTASAAAEVDPEESLNQRAKSYMVKHTEIKDLEAAKDILKMQDKKKEKKDVKKAKRKAKKEAEGKKTANSGKTRENMEYLPNLYKTAVKRNHIIPIQTMQDFFKVIPREGKEFDELMTALLKSYDDEWEAWKRILVEKEDMDDEIKNKEINDSNGKRMKKFVEDKARAKEIEEQLKAGKDVDKSELTSFYAEITAWAPGNLVLGPLDRDKDPGDKFDFIAATMRYNSLNPKTKKETKTEPETKPVSGLSVSEMQNLSDMMKMYSTAASTELLQKIMPLLKNLFSQQIVDATSSAGWKADNPEERSA